jgi:hypothetical protein
MMKEQIHQPFILEITVLSAEGLKTSSSALFSNRVRPFITFTTALPSPYNPCSKGDKKCPNAYRTRVDDEGGTNPTWGDKFRVPLDATFFADIYSSVHLQLYTKRLIVGQALLGWCQIPAHDIGSPPVGSVRYLSYRLRARDGSRSHGIVNLAIKLEALAPVAGRRVFLDSDSPNVDTRQTVIGIPVALSHPWDSVSVSPRR